MEVISPWHTLGRGGVHKKKNSPRTYHLILHDQLVCVCGVLYVNTNVCICMWVHKHVFVIMDRNQGQGGMHHFLPSLFSWFLQTGCLIELNFILTKLASQSATETTCFWPHPSTTGATGFTWILESHISGPHFCLVGILLSRSPSPSIPSALYVRAEKSACFFVIYENLSSPKELSVFKLTFTWIKRYLVDIISVWGPSSLITII